MVMKKIIHRRLHFVKYLLILLLLTACGTSSSEDPALTRYRDDMAACTESIENIAASIDAIDPAAEDASSELLSAVDRMRDAFKDMAGLSAPAAYSSAAALATEAATLMSDCSTLYHTAYDGGSYDSLSAEQARKQYENAMQRLSSIAEIFMETK